MNKKKKWKNFSTKRGDGKGKKPEVKSNTAKAQTFSLREDKALVFTDNEALGADVYDVRFGVVTGLTPLVIQATDVAWVSLGFDYEVRVMDSKPSPVYAIEGTRYPVFMNKGSRKPNQQIPIPKIEVGSRMVLAVENPAIKDDAGLKKCFEPGFRYKLELGQETVLEFGLYQSYNTAWRSIIARIVPPVYKVYRRDNLYGKPVAVGNFEALKAVEELWKNNFSGYMYYVRHFGEQNYIACNYNPCKQFSVRNAARTEREKVVDSVPPSEDIREVAGCRSY